MTRGPAVWLRADASAALGSGHVMRCHALALALRERGAVVGLLARELPSALAAPWHEIAGRVVMLGAGDDAAATRAALDRTGCDALVVDHYGLDAAWERALRPACRVLMALDDLADRPHDADLLLDQNLGRAAGDYDSRVPTACERLIGPRFALLRPDFAAARAASLQRRANGALRHLVVSLGGGDPQQASLHVLRALATATLPAGLRVSVALGPLAPTLADARDLAATLPMSCSVHGAVSDMASLLAEADLAVGAAGGSAWERCCLGVPTLLLVLADNQRAGAQALAEAAAAQPLGTLDQLPRTLPAALHALAEPARLHSMSTAAAAVTDGQGAARVADALLARLEASR